ncbi:MAG: hypothetical protein JO214_12845, partial [Frankiaceae bacterium]|nr:hypothetical protein [Frankiaceae bacterium]
MMDSHNRKIDLVVTTIFEPAWLGGYLADLENFPARDDVTLRIICDRKTPETVWRAAADARDQGFDVRCPTLDEQSGYLSKLGVPDDFIPWNTDNRRNIGYLQAWEEGADLLISIDDDNYCLPGSEFFASHCVVGSRAGDQPGRWAPDGWFNICSMLEFEEPGPIFPRGFPYAERGAAPATTATARPDDTIAFNAGLWLSDPDVDAISRLSLRPVATAAAPEASLLGPYSWSPINTQNTSLSREALPSYYYVKMGFPIQGMRIDRFGDILSGYFLQKCAKQAGQVARVGSPVADHVRTPHNLMQDL